MDLEHERRMTEIDARSKSNTKRIDEMEKRQDDLAELVSTVKVLALREAKVENDVEEIKNDIKSLTNKPAQRWENLIDKTITTIVAALIGFLMAKIGL